MTLIEIRQESIIQNQFENPNRDKCATPAEEPKENLPATSTTIIENNKRPVNRDETNKVVSERVE